MANAMLPAWSRPPASAAPPSDGLPLSSGGLTPAAVGKPPLSTVAAQNSHRLAVVVCRLIEHLNQVVRREEEFLSLCNCLARGIDYALTVKDVPKVSPYIPFLVKKLYEYKNDTHLQPAITAVMISAKNASRDGWFGGSVANELIDMANELCSSYCMMISNAAETTVLDTLSKVIARYYPGLKLCQLILSFEAKTGYDVLMADFRIQRKIYPDRMIGLFVVQKDNLDTSVCIVNPPQVSFMINGRGVDRRSNISLDSGPQFPTNISKMLKYGTNIIQAVGYFGANYIIAVSFMEETTPTKPILEEYIQPVVSSFSSGADSEIIEGQSRISLKCPISLGRIIVPVKGHVCKHHQCFDYDNYIQLNLRKPSWRCPCCNQPVSFIDIRIDLKMVKILAEAGENCVDVIVFADGSWKLSKDSIQNASQLSHKATPVHEDDSICEVTKCKGTLNEFVDLTNEDDDEITSVNESLIWNDEANDTKPCKGVQNFIVSNSEPVCISASETMHTVCNQTQVDVCSTSALCSSVSDGSFVRNVLPCQRMVGNLGSIVPGTVLNPENISLAYNQGCNTSPGMVLNPVISDNVSPVFNKGCSTSHAIEQFLCAGSENSQENMQTQWLQCGNYGTERQPILNVSLTPQSMPAQIQRSDSVQRMQSQSISSSTFAINPTQSHSISIRDIQDRLNAAEPGFQVEHPVGTLQSAQLLSVTQIQDQPAEWNVENQVSQHAASKLLWNSRGPFELQNRLNAYGASSRSVSQFQNTQWQTYTCDYQQMSNPILNRYGQSSYIPSATVQQAEHSISRTGLSLTREPIQLNSHHGVARPDQQPENAGPSMPIMADALVHSSNDHQRSTNLAAFNSVRTMDALGVHTLQNFQPTRRMRASLDGEALLAAMNRYNAQPTQIAPFRGHASTNFIPTGIQPLLPNRIDALNSLMQQP